MNYRDLIKWADNEAQLNAIYACMESGSMVKAAKSLGHNPRTVERHIANVQSNRLKRITKSVKRVKKGKKPKSNGVTLVIGCTHCPFNHKDMFEFLAEVKNKYSPATIIHDGDEADWHSLSYHESVPELPCAGQELEFIQRDMAQMEELFPFMTVIDSNHGNLPARKAQTIGFPQGMIKNKAELYGTTNWEFVFDLVHEGIYYHHGKNANVLNLSKVMGMPCVQAHYHSKMGAWYYGSPDRLMWGAQTGCLVDVNSMAMAYGRNTLDKPMLGCLIIQDGIPRTVPMRLNKKGRWDGKVC